MIKGITGRLPERYKIKIGGHGEKRKSQAGKEFRLPVKFDHIRICTLEKDETDNFIPDYELMEKLGSECVDGDPQKPTVIGPVSLLYNDLNLSLFCSYRKYKGRDCICKGNGIQGLKPATGEACECNPGLCQDLRNKLCKPNGILSVMFPELPLGGMAKFRTTSWNSISSLMGGLTMISLSARGKIAGVPLFLRLNKSIAQVQGKAQEIYFLSIEFQGNMSDLRQEVLEYTKGETKQILQIEHVEEQARKELALSDQFDAEDEDSDPSEFYPDAEEHSSGTVTNPKTKKLESAPPSKAKAKFGGKKTKPEPEPEPEREPDENDPMNADEDEEEPII